MLYCYGVYQPLFNEMSESITNISFHEGLPNELDNFAKDSKHSLVTLDDLVDDVVRHTDMQKLFTQGAHHLRLSVLFITHNCFQQVKCSRTISLNTHDLILFRNMRDGQQIVSFGKQLQPGKGMVLIEA